MEFENVVELSQIRDKKIKLDIKKKIYNNTPVLKKIITPSLEEVDVTGLKIVQLEGYLYLPLSEWLKFIELNNEKSIKSASSDK